ncbi:MAG: hypothetical protein WKF34_14025 [Pyrinomonadaceae bacterium]
MKYSKILLSVLIALVAFSAAGQKLAEKPLEKWSKDDALEVLNNSAWAKPYQSTTGSANAAASQIAREQGQTASSGGSNPRSVGRDFGPPPVTLRLFSAMPIRQAMVRLRQVDINYDKLTGEEKKKFDASQAKFLECAICKDYYVVTLNKAVDSSGNTTEEGIFQGMTAAELKGNIRLLNDKGEMRELVQFNPPRNARDQAVFYFKRLNEAGQPLLTKESKNVKFVFDSAFLATKNRFAYLLPRTFEFAIQKMMVKDDIVF